MSTISAFADETREFVTRMVLDTYTDRQAQRCIPTFVTVAGGVLDSLSEKGGLHFKQGFAMGELTQLIGHLNMFRMAVVYKYGMEVEELAGHLRGVGYSYELTDQQIADWQEALRKCVGDDEVLPTGQIVQNKTKMPFLRLVTFFDRVVEPTTRIWGANFYARARNWLELIGDINVHYEGMMKNPEWIAELDAVLDRVEVAVRRALKDFPGHRPL